MNLGEKIERLYELKKQKTEVNAQLKELDDKYKALEAEIIGALDAVGVDSAKSEHASVTTSTMVVPSLEDWDALSEYILETGQTFLLERRVAVTAFRDLLGAGEAIPGVSPIEKRSLSLRKR